MDERGAGTGSTGSPWEFHWAITPKRSYDAYSSPPDQGGSLDEYEREDLGHASPKKRKLELPSCAGLPAEIWQHVVRFLSPQTLGRLLRLNRAFHLYLTNVGGCYGSRPIPGRLSIVDSDDIWAFSRRVYHPSMPRPLAMCSELRMWKLIKGVVCEFCGALPRKVPTSHRSWSQRSGWDEVRPIWAFAVRCCGKCLAERSQMVR